MSRASAIGLTAGVVYALVYLILAFDAAGAGHGTFIFFAPISPYCLGLFIFPLVEVFHPLARVESQSDAFVERHHAEAHITARHRFQIEIVNDLRHHAPSSAATAVGLPAE